MANSGAFRKGEKRQNQGKHGSPKVNLAVKDAISRLLDAKADKLGEWLDEIYKKDGARVAFDCFAKLLEFHLPKKARSEWTGEDGSPLNPIGGIQVTFVSPKGGAINCDPINDPVNISF